MEESHEESLNVGKLFKCVVLTHSSGLRLLKRVFSLPEVFLFLDTLKRTRSSKINTVVIFLFKKRGKQELP